MSDLNQLEPPELFDFGLGARGRSRFCAKALDKRFKLTAAP
jgi:hypothetical protein